MVKINSCFRVSLTYVLLMVGIMFTPIAEGVAREVTSGKCQLERIVHGEQRETTGWQCSVVIDENSMWFSLAGKDSIEMRRLESGKYECIPNPETHGLVSCGLYEKINGPEEYLFISQRNSIHREVDAAHHEVFVYVIPKP